MKFTEFEHNDNWKIKKFPCSCCLVKPACNSYISCELLEQNKQKIYNLIIEGKCPDCGESINEYMFNVSDYCGHLFRLSRQYKMAWRDRQ